MGATSLAVREAQASRDTSWEPMLRLLIEQERAGQPLAADIAASLLKRRPCKEHERLLALALGQRGTLILPDHPRRPRATGARPSCKARGVILEFSIESNSTELADELKKIGLSTLVGEIRWGRPKSQGCYLHGVALQNLTETQSQEIQRLLRSVVTSRALKKTG